jgi:CMP-N,N'-diacetyllegionaminic acid synthase
VRNIAVIPARSGSKGVKDKNIKLLNGKPLMAYTIEAARDSGVFDTIFVSTDSDKYAKTARAYGAETPFLRGEALASDTAASRDVVLEALNKYAELAKTFDTVALLQPTSPLRTGADIRNGYALMEQRNADCVVGVCETEHSPLWCNTLPPDGSLKGFISEALIGVPRQKLGIYYRINGALYIVRYDYLLAGGSFYGPRSYAYVMSKESSIDIDDEFDFLVAAAFIRGRR